MLRTDEICQIEPWRARAADALQEVVALVRVARVDELPARQENELVEERHDVAPRLVDGEDDCAVVVACERD